MGFCRIERQTATNRGRYWGHVPNQTTPRPPPFGSCRVSCRCCRGPCLSIFCNIAARFKSVTLLDVARLVVPRDCVCRDTKRKRPNDTTHNPPPFGVGRVPCLLVYHYRATSQTNAARFHVVLLVAVVVACVPRCPVDDSI